MHNILIMPNTTPIETAKIWGNFPRLWERWIWQQNINIPLRFASQQMPFHHPSFDKHFSSLSKHDKSSVFLHVKVEVRECRNQIDTKYIKPKHCRLHNRNSKIWQGNLEHLFLDEICWNLSKFVILKHFEWDVLHKESSALFLFSIYMFKSVFCRDISAEHVKMSMLDVYKF